MEERHLTLSEVARWLAVSERTVRRWIKSGDIKAYRPGRDFRIPESAVREFIEESEVYPKGLEPPLPFEDQGDRLQNTALWSSFINERAGDLEEWGYSFHKGADPAELPEREFLAFVGGVSVAAEEYSRLGQIVDAFYQEMGESLSEELARAWRRLSRSMQAMLTAGVEQRIEQLEPGTLPDNVIHLQDRKTA